MKNLRHLAILLIALLSTTLSSAATYYSITTGNWNTNTTWSLTSGGTAVGTGIYPKITDNVIIEGGFIVSTSGNSACASLQVNNGTMTYGTGNATTDTIAGNLTIGASGTINGFTHGASQIQLHNLYVKGSISCNGNLNADGKGKKDNVKIYLNGTTQTISGTGAFVWNSLVVNSGSTTTVTSNSAQQINSDLTIAGTLDFGTTNFNRATTGGTLTVSGKMILGSNIGGQTGSNFPTSFSTMTLTGGTIVYNYAGAQTVYSTPVYTNLTLSGSGVKTLSGATVNGILSMEGTATATGTPNYAGTATLQYKGSGSLSTSNNEFPAGFAGSGGIIIDQGAGNTVTLNANKTSIAGNLNIKSGTFDLSTFTANRASAGGTLTVASGAALKIGGTNTLPSNYTTHSISCSSTIEYSGTNQTVANLNSAQSYGNLTLSGSGTKTLQTGTTAICNNFTITGTANTTGVVGLTIGGNVLIDATASFTAGAYEHSIGGNWTKTGTFNATGSTINFNSSSASQNIGTSSFNNISFTGAGTKTATGILTIAGNVTINSNFTAGSYTHPVAGNWTNNGTLTAGSGTITMTATTAKTIGGSASSQFNNLTLNETGSSTLGVNASVTGTLTLTQGLIDLDTYTLTVANISGGSSGSYIKTSSTGRLKRLVTTGGTVYSFPVGNSAYNPISFSSSATGNGNSDYFSIRVDDGALTNANVNAKTVNRKWYLMTATTGITSLTVTPQYNAGETGASFNASSGPKVGFFTGTAWGYSPTATAVGSGPYTITASGTAPDASSSSAFVALGSEDAFSASKLSITVLPPTPYRGVNSSVATIQSQNSQGVPTWVLQSTYFDLTSNKSVTRVGGLTGFAIAAGTHETIINNLEFLESTWNALDQVYDVNATVTANRMSGENLTNGVTPNFAIKEGSVYRPTTNGNWDNVPWEISNNGGSSWTITTLPTDNIFSESDVIQIPANISLTANTNATFNSLIVFGTLDISGSATLTLNHSTSDLVDYNISVYGTLKNSGGAIINTNAAYVPVYFYGGTYWHNRDGGSIPTAAWNTLSGTPSTCKVTGITSTAITSGLEQSFQHFIWDNSSQSTAQTLSADMSVRNTLTLTNGVITTGSNKVIVEPGGTTVSTNNARINGNIRIHIPATSSPTINFPIGDANYYTPLSVAFTGTIVGSGYLDAYTSAAQPSLATGLSQTKYINRIWTVSNTNISGFTSFNTTFTFADADKTGSPNTSNLVVRKRDNNIWAVTTVGNRTANSTECTNMTSFSDFSIGEDDCTSTNFVWLGGTNTDWNTASNWCYNQIPTATVDVTIPSGPINQPIIGTTATCNNISIANGASLTISGSNTLDIKGNLTNNGTVTANSSTVSFTGTSAQTVTGSTTLNNLTINNTAGVIAANDLTVNGTLNLQSANASATVGALEMGANTLNMGTNALTTGTGDVTGIVKRQQTFVGNTAYSFGNQYTTISFTNVPNATKPTWISCKIALGTVPTWRSQATKRVYSFAQDGTGNDRTVVHLHYLDTELHDSETDETKLVFWDAYTGPSYSSFFPRSKSNFDATNNWIGLAGMAINFFAPNSTLDYKQWGLGYTNVTKIIWTGNGSPTYAGDWSLPGNWNGGVPTANDDVLIPATLPGDTHGYPTRNLNSGTTPAVANSIEIENGATLTVDNYPITISGSTGAWINTGTFVPGSGNIIFNHNNIDEVVSISGNTNFYNLTFGANTLMRPNNGSYLGIGGNLTADGSSILEFSSSNNTVEFKGENQSIPNPIGLGLSRGYYNLIFSNSGTSTLPSQLNIGGNLTTNAIIDATTNSTTLIFDGASAQSISGSVSPTITNLTINNAAGVTASTDMTLNGALTFISDNPTSNDKGALAMATDKILDLGINSSSTGPGDVTGIIRRNHSFATSTFYSYGNANNGVTFATVSGYPGQVMPTSLSLKVSIGSAPDWSAYSGAVMSNPIKRSFEIIQTGGSGNRAIMQVHYRDNEVPAGINENDLTIWTSSNVSGTYYNKESGRSNYNTDLNFISIQDINMNVIPSTWGYFKATLAPSAATNYTWNGSISTDWNTTSNWTPNSIPNSTHGAIIPNTYTTTYAPKLPSNTTCKSIQINAGGVLNAPTTGGLLTISGANNAWSVENGGVFNSNTSVVYFSANAATEGNTSISGTTNFYSAIIASGALLRPATDCYMGISGTLTINGTLAAATNENTIEFKGTNQSIPNPNGSTPGYHNMVLSGSGTKTLPTTLNIIDEFTNNTTGTVDAGTGTVVLSQNSLYGQKISGSALTTFNNLTIDNPTNTVSVKSNIAVNGTLSISSGTILDMETNSLSGTISSISGTGSIYTQNTSSTPLSEGKTWSGTVAYNGTIAQTAVAGTYNNLTISNIAGCTASGDITVNQTLNLAANNPSATHGLLELVSDWQSYPSTGNATPESFTSHTLFMGSSAVTIGLGDATGIIKRNYAVNANTSYTFGNEFTTIAVSTGASPIIPSSLTVVSKIGSTPAGKADAIQRSYQIIPASNGANCFIAANFHYLDSELQSSISPNFQNAESKLVTWDYDLDGGTAEADEHGRASYDFNNNFIGLSNVPISYFIYNESHLWRTIFTIADHSDTKFLTWKGATSTDWSDGGNWLPFGNTPDSTTFVIIPNAATTTYSPILPVTAELNTLTIENGGILTMGNSTLTIKNSMSGGWEDQNSQGNDPGTSTVIFAHSGATVSGTVRFYNMTINSNATLTNAANSTVKIINTLTNDGSWFTDNSNNTVEYSGTGQTVILPSGTANYHNLTLSGNGTVSLPNSHVNINGNLIIGSNITTDINQNISIKGNFTNNSYNFTNSAATITFNGNTNQSISGTGTTIFNKLTIDNSGFTVNAGSPFGVADTLKLTSGSTLNMGNQSLTTVESNSGTGTITTQNTGSSPIPADKTWSSKIVYNNQTSAQTVVAGTYNNLEITNPIAANASGTINATTLTIDNRAILNMGTNVLSNFTTNSGTGMLTTQSTSTTPIPTGKTWTSQVMYNGSEFQTAVEGTFNTLTIDNSTGVSLASNASVSVQGNLLINNSKKLYIPTLTMMNAQSILNNAGTIGITIQSSSTSANGSLVFHNSTSSPVTATVEMYSKASALTYNPATNTYSNYKWEFFGIPLQSVTADPTFAGSYVRKHNESGTSSSTRWQTVTNSTVLTPVSGYEITQPAATTITFQGQLVNSSLTKTLPYTAGATYPGQSILSNPYTASIDIAQLNFGTGADETVYIYNTGSYADWNQTNNVDENSPGQYLAVPKGVAGERIDGFQWKIPSMQGFMVKLSGTSSSSLEIPYNAVIIKNTDRQRVRNNSPTSVYTKIDVTGTRYSDKMWIITNPTCSHGYDNGWDGTKFIGSSLAPQIWAMETAGDYQVDAVDNINNTSLGFMCGENATYTLTFTHESSTSAYPALYLLDLQDNHITDISVSGTQYTFSSNQTTIPTTARFKIVTSLGVTTGNDASTDALNIFNSNKIVYINNNSGITGDLMVYDVTGRFIQKYPFNANGLTTIATNLTTGAYLLKATTSGKEKIREVIIK